MVVVDHDAAGRVVCESEGKRTSIAVRLFVDEGVRKAQMRRKDPTPERLSQVPVGSLWRSGSHTFRVISHDEDGVCVRNVKIKNSSRMDRVGLFLDFASPQASFKRVQPAQKGGR